jgi:hypothetical protein
MSAISLYPMETIRVLNNVYMEQTSPDFTSVFDSSNNNSKTVVIPSGPNETVILKTNTQSHANVDSLFTTMGHLLTDISNNLGNPGLVSSSVNTLFHSLSTLKDSYYL